MWLVARLVPRMVLFVQLIHPYEFVGFPEEKLKLNWAVMIESDMDPLLARGVSALLSGSTNSSELTSSVG